MEATEDEMTGTGIGADMTMDTMRGSGPGRSGGRVTIITQTGGRMTGEPMTTSSDTETTEDREILTETGGMDMTSTRMTTAGATSKDMTRQTDSVTTTGFGLNRSKDSSE